MPSYAVVYRDGKGQSHRETRQSSSREQLITDLREAGAFPISVQPTRDGAPRGSRGGGGIQLTRVKLEEITLAFRTLATLQGGGIPIMQALNDVGEQAESPRLRRIFQNVARDVQTGSTISGACAKHPEAFSPLACSLIEAGEESGSLNRTLMDLSDYLEAQLELRRKVKAGTRYPMFIMLFFLAAVAVLFGAILPRFAKVFSNLPGDQELPALTTTLMSVSDAFANNFLYILLGLGAMVGGFVAARRTARGRLVLDRLLLRLPVVGRVVQQVIMARFARTLGLLLDSGVPVVQAISLTSRSVGNTAVTEQIDEIRGNVMQGASVSAELAARPDYFPPLISRMASAGEETGKLGDMFGRVSVHLSKEAGAAIDGLLAMLEPALIVALGGVVGVVVGAVYLPLFQMGQASMGMMLLVMP